jgi:hypothetical protein
LLLEVTAPSILPHRATHRPTRHSKPVRSASRTSVSPTTMENVILIGPNNRRAAPSRQQQKVARGKASVTVWSRRVRPALRAGRGHRVAAALLPLDPSLMPYGVQRLAERFAGNARGRLAAFGGDPCFADRFHLRQGFGGQDAGHAPNATPLGDSGWQERSGKAGEEHGRFMSLNSIGNRHSAFLLKGVVFGMASW